MKTITKMFEVMLTKSATPPPRTVTPAAGGPVSQWGWGG